MSRAMVANLTPREQGKLIRFHARVAVSEHACSVQEIARQECVQAIARTAARLVNQGRYGNTDEAIQAAQRAAQELILGDPEGRV